MPRKRIRSRRDTGDVLTGDGIQRVSAEQPLLTPNGGEGGSVLQALGSKAEERVKRRKKKKDSYAEYLETPAWRKIRAAALKRDKHTCRACQGKAWVVHHVRYPKNLGQEKMEWLYSLCAPCHDAIHRAAVSMTLKQATNLILGAVREGNVTRLPDDPRLSKSATKARHRKKMRKQPPRTPKKRKKVVVHSRKKSRTEKENDRLHEIFKRNREYRQRRWGDV